MALVKSADEIEDARRNPSRCFASPDAVVRARDLTTAQKLDILRAWELDERQLQTAAGENMPGGEQDRLREVVTAIANLEDADDARHNGAETSSSPDPHATRELTAVEMRQARRLGVVWKILVASLALAVIAFLALAWFF